MTICTSEHDVVCLSPLPCVHVKASTGDVLLLTKWAAMCGTVFWYWLRGLRYGGRFFGLRPKDIHMLIPIDSMTIRSIRADQPTATTLSLVRTFIKSSCISMSVMMLPTVSTARNSTNDSTNVPCSISMIISMWPSLSWHVVLQRHQGQDILGDRISVGT
jgi:hypothetical protein